MRSSILTFFFVAVCSFFAIAQNQQEVMADLMVDIGYLSSDLLEGRKPGTKGGQLSAAYIARRMEDIGLEPAGEHGTWLQHFVAHQKKDPHKEGSVNSEHPTANVLGMINNKAKTTVVIGAHYDHLGYGGPSSRHVGEPAIHNGADDNASGVGALLVLAERLNNNRKISKKNNYLFMAFAAEEMGLLGSKYFVAHPTVQLDKVNYMINMDMVGRLNKDTRDLMIYGVGTSPIWKPVIHTHTEGSFSLKMTDSGIGPTDHTSFYLKDLPVLQFFTGTHDDYHKPSDDPQYLNYEGIVDIVDFIYAIVVDLNDNGKLAFTKTKDERKEGRRKYKVTLGVMPDYAFDGKGMHIDAVMDGRPAGLAGIQDGDVIIKIGDKVVNDIYDYMDGLGAYNVGDKALITIKRGEEELDFEVVF